MMRPFGVTFIAVLCFLWAAVAVILEIRLFARIDFIGTFSNADEASGLAELGAILLLDIIVFPVLQVIAGWSLWKLKNWGRILTIALLTNGSVFALLRWLLTPHSKTSRSVATLVSCALYGMIIWYLLKPDVKAAFLPPNQSRT